MVVVLLIAFGVFCKFIIRLLYIVFFLTTSLLLPLPYVLSGIGSGGVGGMVDPDGRLAQRLRHNIANNRHYCEGTGTPITVMGALRNLQRNSTSEFLLEIQLQLIC